MTSPLPFEIVTDDAYASAFAATCTPHKTRRGLLLTGTCPRCGDRMDFPVPTRVFQNPLTAAPAAKTEPVMCTCKNTHSGRPADDEGCGAYWNIELSQPTP
jgi:hypothetical protein